MKKKNLRKDDVVFYKAEIEYALGENVLNLNDIIDEEKQILYGTFGYHDSEPPHSIVLRKINEVKENKYSLWGTTINASKIKIIQTFCEQIEGNVYLFLKFTNSTDQLRADNPSYDIWSIDKLIKEENVYDCYIDQHEQIHSLDSEKTNIIVKGSALQNAAFVVKNYYFCNGGFKRKKFLHCYEGIEYNGKNKKRGNYYSRRVHACY